MNRRLFPFFCLGACLVSAACPSGPSAPGRDKARVLERRIDFINDLTSRRGLAARALDELSAALPDGIWLTEVVYDTEGIRLKGRAPSNTLLADYVSSLGARPSLTGVALQSSVQKQARNREYQEFALQALVKNARAVESSGPGAGPGSGDVTALAGRLEELEKILPPRKETADLLRQFQRAAGDSGLKITRFAPGTETPGESYNEWPVAVEVAGSRQGLIRFLKGLTDWPRLWLIKKCSFKAVSNDDADSPVRASLTAQTFLVGEAAAAGAEGHNLVLLFLHRLFQRPGDKGVQALPVAERSDGEGPVKLRTGPQHEPAGIIPVGRGREGAPVLPVSLDPFVDNPAELLIDLRLIIAVATVADPARNRTDVTPVFFRPPYQLEVFVTRFHRRPPRFSAGRA